MLVYRSLEIVEGDRDALEAGTYRGDHDLELKHIIDRQSPRIPHKGWDPSALDKSTSGTDSPRITPRDNKSSLGASRVEIAEHDASADGYGRSRARLIFGMGSARAKVAVIEYAIQPMGEYLERFGAA
jgi:hypothetical protein